MIEEKIDVSGICIPRTKEVAGVIAGRTPNTYLLLQIAKKFFSNVGVVQADWRKRSADIRSIYKYDSRLDWLTIRSIIILLNAIGYLTIRGMGVV